MFGCYVVLWVDFFGGLYEGGRLTHSKNIFTDGDEWLCAIDEGGMERLRQHQGRGWTWSIRGGQLRMSI